MDEIRVPATREALLALQDIERRRLVDMYDREMVILLADIFRHEAGSRWLAEHRHLYFRALASARAGSDVRPGEPALVGIR